MIKVASFATDHTTLDAGVYLRDTIRVGLFSKVLVWDLRFYAPRDHQYMSPGTMHSIEHIIAYKLREYLGDGYVQTAPYGCTTGFLLITKSYISRTDVIDALISTIDDVCPILSKSDIPALTEKECGRPSLYSIKDTNTALLDYRNVLESLSL